MTDFRLSDNFMSDYIGKQPEWGALGYITFKNKYARPIENRTEEWWETCKRVIEGTYNIQKTWCERHVLSWNGVKAQHSAQMMYELMWNFKFLPPGRGIWMMGTDYITERKTSAPLFNCSFVSSKDLKVDFADPFCFLMDMSMLGVGVGFDTKGAGTIKIKEPKKGTYTYIVEDTREAWVEIVKITLDSYVGKGTAPKTIDYSKVRPHGAVIKSFGGTASGFGPLKELVEQNIPKILSKLAEEESNITSTAIVDIFNAIGRCVVAGNTRRSAELALGDPEDLDFLNLKDKATHPEFFNKEGKFTHPWRWASNNSISARVGMDYSDIASRTINNGEPGYFWLENARTFGRMCDPPNNLDRRVEGTNPCFSGDTKIAVADGRGTVSIEELAKEGKDISVYSVNPNTGEVKIKWGRNPRLTGRNKELIKITLDDGTTFKVTPNHKIPLLNGSTKRADELILNDKLHRFNKRLEKNSKWSGFSNQEIETTAIQLTINIKRKFSVKVIAIQKCNPEDTFNITVDDYHTLAIVTKIKNNHTISGIFTFQCGEISLEHQECCNVPETFPARHDSYAEYEKTLKYAYLYGKTVSLLPTHNSRTNAVQLRNRRIGLSQSGVAQNIQKIGMRNHLDWCNKGYNYLRKLDEIYSDWLCVPRSKKITSVKPGGTTPLLPGSTPGIHYSLGGKYYYRVMRFSANSDIVKAARKAKYRVEEAEGIATSLVYFPVEEKDCARSIKDISIWEQVETAAQMQYWWADNQVSVTIQFHEHEAQEIPRILEIYETRLKSISFLPHSVKEYAHPPYQPITEEEYKKAIKKLKPLVLNKSQETEGFKHVYCDNDTCVIT